MAPSPIGSEQVMRRMEAWEWVRLGGLAAVAAAGMGAFVFFRFFYQTGEDHAISAEEALDQRYPPVALVTPVVDAWENEATGLNVIWARTGTGYSIGGTVHPKLIIGCVLEEIRLEVDWGHQLQDFGVQAQEPIVIRVDDRPPRQIYWNISGDTNYLSRRSMLAPPASEILGELEGAGTLLLQGAIRGEFQLFGIDRVIMAVRAHCGRFG